jgi:hypothetical protein
MKYIAMIFSLLLTSYAHAGGSAGGVSGSAIKYVINKPEFDRLAVESVIRREVRLDSRTLVPQKIELDLGEITLTDSISDENVTFKLDIPQK